MFTDFEHCVKVTKNYAIEAARVPERKESSTAVEEIDSGLEYR